MLRCACRAIRQRAVHLLQRRPRHAPAPPYTRTEPSSRPLGSQAKHDLSARRVLCNASSGLVKSGCSATHEFSAAIGRQSRPAPPNKGDGPKAPQDASHERFGRNALSVYEQPASHTREFCGESLELAQPPLSTCHFTDLLDPFLEMRTMGRGTGAGRSAQSMIKCSLFAAYVTSCPLRRLANLRMPFSDPGEARGSGGIAHRKLRRRTLSPRATPSTNRKCLGEECTSKGLTTAPLAG